MLMRNIPIFCIKYLLISVSKNYQVCKILKSSALQEIFDIFDALSVYIK